MLLARIYDARPLQCPRCGNAMTILSFILDPVVIKRILDHLDLESEPPATLPARSPPQGELEFAQASGPVIWDEVDQTSRPAGRGLRTRASESSRGEARQSAGGSGLRGGDEIGPSGLRNDASIRSQRACREVHGRFSCESAAKVW